VSYFAMDRLDAPDVAAQASAPPAVEASAAPAPASETTVVLAAAPVEPAPAPAPAPEAPVRSAAPADRGEPPWQGPVELAAVASDSPPDLGPTPGIQVITGKIPSGGTLSKALADQSVSPRVVYQIEHAIRPVFDFRYARPGDFFSLIQDDQEGVLSFEFQRGRQMIYRLREQDGALVANASEVPLELRVTRLGGVIDRSLFDSLIALGEDGDLVHEFADIFVWDFDFSTQTRPGDEFRMVFEKYYDPSGFVRYGRVLAARYQTATRSFTSIYFEEEDGYGDYFTLEGNSVRRSFLRAPVKYTHISSRYSRGRLHPILKVRRPHLGVDYAAPAGTPVWAVGDGTVIYKGWSGGFGRLVKLRHNNGYVSYYGHLQRYAQALKVGDKVRQKQVLGYVGSTGLATGPHLDFRLKSSKGFVDPLRVDFPKGKRVSVQAKQSFESVRDERLRDLELAAPALILEARQQTLAE
jgi:murein DD-endopeptidase MepM/ murein hydrolase activator NlpD